MKNISFLLLFLLGITTVLFLGASCNSKATQLLSDQQTTLNKTFDLRYGTTMGLVSENMSISFEKLTESRCPKDVNCIQAGKGIVTLKVTVENQSEDLVLSVKGLCEDEPRCGEAKNVLQYNITLMSLTPYPGAVLMDEKQYVAQMVVTEKSNVPTGDER